MKFKDWLRMRNACHESLEWLGDREWLARKGACAEAFEWVGDKTLREAWRTCHRGDWMFWLSRRAARANFGDEPTFWSYREQNALIDAWLALRAEQNLDQCFLAALNEETPYQEALARLELLTANFIRSVCPDPPVIEGMEGVS